MFSSERMANALKSMPPDLDNNQEGRVERRSASFARCRLLKQASIKEKTFSHHDKLSADVTAFQLDPVLAVMVTPIREGEAEPRSTERNTSENAAEADLLGPTLVERVESEQSRVESLGLLSRTNEAKKLSSLELLRPNPNESHEKERTASPESIIRSSSVRRAQSFDPKAASKNVRYAGPRHSIFSSELLADALKAVPAAFTAKVEGRIERRSSSYAKSRRLKPMSLKETLLSKSDKRTADVMTLTSDPVLAAEVNANPESEEEPSPTESCETEKTASPECLIRSSHMRRARSFDPKSASKTRRSTAMFSSELIASPLKSVPAAFSIKMEGRSERRSSSLKVASSEDTLLSHADKPITDADPLRAARGKPTPEGKGQPNATNSYEKKTAASADLCRPTRTESYNPEKSAPEELSRLSPSESFESEETSPRAFLRPNLTKSCEAERTAPPDFFRPSPTKKLDSERTASPEDDRSSPVRRTQSFQRKLSTKTVHPSTPRHSSSPPMRKTSSFKRRSRTRSLEPVPPPIGICQMSGCVNQHVM
ncbi:MAG: hypothetical protein SGPRY_009238 [Prymnesium sp.]